MCFQDLEIWNFSHKEQGLTFQLRVWWWGKRKHKSASESDPCGPSSSGGFGAEEPSFAIFFIFPSDALYNSPFDVTVATSDATVTAPKLGYKMRVFPALVWDLNTLFILSQASLIQFPGKWGSVWDSYGLTIHIQAPSLSPTVGAVQGWRRTSCWPCICQLQVAIAHPGQGLALLVLDVPGAAWSECYLFFSVHFVCTCGHTCWSKRSLLSVAPQVQSTLIYLFIEIVLSTTCQIG